MNHAHTASSSRQGYSLTDDTVGNCKIGSQLFDVLKGNYYLHVRQHFLNSVRKASFHRNA